MNCSILHIARVCISPMFVSLILLISSSSLSAADVRSKDWVWNVDKDKIFYAGTTNKSGHFFAQFCDLDSELCYYIIAPKITCNEDAELPALINSDQGAIHVTLVCGHLYEGANLLYITPFDDIDLIVRQSSYFRIAVPMESDQFKVVRFSLVGSTYAVDLMRAATEKAIDIIKTKQAPDEEYL